jgi:ribulose-5-phosphate 4-epimerase/fuculose-1-phosphate aldolase
MVTLSEAGNVCAFVLCLFIKWFHLSSLLAERQIYNRAAYCIHAAIHAARPDVDAAAHSHSIYGKAFSALGKTLGISFFLHITILGSPNSNFT